MVGWMLIDSKTLDPYGWIVRCADHPPQTRRYGSPCLGLTARSRRTARNAVSI